MNPWRRPLRDDNFTQGTTVARVPASGHYAIRLWRTNQALHPDGSPEAKKYKSLRNIFLQILRCDH